MTREQQRFYASRLAAGYCPDCGDKIEEHAIEVGDDIMRRTKAKWCCLTRAEVPVWFNPEPRVSFTQGGR
jgi:hypothetical protein